MVHKSRSKTFHSKNEARTTKVYTDLPYSDFKHKMSCPQTDVCAKRSNLEVKIEIAEELETKTDLTVHETKTHIF